MFDLIPNTHRNSNSIYNPFRMFDEMEKDFFDNRALDDFKVDVRECNDHYEMEADLPGFDKKDIHVDLDNDTLTIQAERRSDYEDKDKQGNYLRCERSYGSFSRSFGVDGIDTDGIRVSYQDGVLRLLLPKVAPASNGTRRLEIE